MTKTLKFAIAEITIAIEGDIGDHQRVIPAAYLPFRGHAKTDIRLRLHRQASRIPDGEKVFECPPIWTLYRQNDRAVIKIFDKLNIPGSTLVFDDALQTADLYPADHNGRFPDPFAGPTLELLMIHDLALGKGGIIHACGIEQDGRGILFAGESGAGKSTLARMWDQESKAQILSDDRTIVRQKAGEFRMYGTPWHGEAKFGAARGVKLRNIIFLRHGPKNSIRNLKAAEIVLQLLKCSFPPHWDKAGMDRTLQFFSAMAARLPCQELTFRPDNSVLDFIKENVKIEA